MSGFEIVGVILGALPLIIEGIKYYHSVIPSREELRNLYNDIEGEYLRLQSTCEALLDGVAPVTEIDRLVRDPFGPEWERYSAQVKLRLWRSPDTLIRRLSDMSEAVEELKEMLALGEDGQPRVEPTPIAILRELKQETSFTLKSKAYQNQVAIIRSGNDTFDSLMQRSRDHAPRRERQSRGRYISLMRRQSHGVFRAMCTATTCTCVACHNLCLELVPRDAYPTPDQSDDEIALHDSFHIIFESSITGARIRPDQHHLNTHQNSHWDCLHITARRRNQNGAIITNPPPRPLQASKRKRLWDWTRSLFEKKPDFHPPIHLEEQVVISDMCQAVRTRQGLPDTACFGLIGETEREFGVHNQDHGLSFDTKATLDEFLNTRQLNLEVKGKLQMASVMSIGLLHLYDTEWMWRPWKLDDVLVFPAEANDPAGYTEISLRPFLRRSVSPPANARDLTGGAENRHRPLNLAVLSLASILTQVVVGRRIEDLDMPTEPDFLSMYRICELGTSLLGEVLENGGEECRMTLQWCFDTALDILNLSHADYCYVFYSKVVMPLRLTQGNLNNVLT